MTIADRDELLTHTGDDPFIRYDVRLLPGYPPVRLGRAAGVVRLPMMRRAPHLTVIGPADDVDRLLQWYGSNGLPDGVRGVSVEQSQQEALRRSFDVGRGGDWDWMWTKTAPARVEEEDLLLELDDGRDARDVLRLNEIGSPTAESMPGEGMTEHWVGVRHEGDLVAAAAVHRTSGGAQHLTGIVVHPEHRGRRLGLAMTAHLTRRAVEQEGVCTLGMYSDNARARALYEGLGYRVAHSWASRAVRLRRDDDPVRGEGSSEAGDS
ncbi:GNAT family N-acetyltransferase [Luteipulveratus sp. YIM 133132]|uniref:GNAT family N-acetyltransferase n=1 Tax=Luteipulveratus flavus TaxID=3031728 RepID=UPI0023AF1DF9|nr:GNAT family N-acetyltransferase [Luteipulveratus sp. YIM 133132]MDE9366076.1 GNAT family N-acetyltransferase [Luteipulveratus sp. YIM 133132]